MGLVDPKAQPLDAAIDGKGNIYVADPSNSIKVDASGAVRPTRVLTHNIFLTVQGLAADANDQRVRIVLGRYMGSVAEFTGEAMPDVPGANSALDARTNSRYRSSAIDKASKKAHSGYRGASTVRCSFGSIAL